MKGRTRASRSTALITATALAGAFGGLALSGMQAQAAPTPPSNLLIQDAWPSGTLLNGTTITVDANPTPATPPPNHSMDVFAGLDSNCSQAISSTMYKVVPSPTSGFFTVSPTSASGLTCGQAQDFTITGVAATVPAGVTLTFTPLAKNGGLTKKLGGPVTITVVVVDTTGGGNPCTVNCTPAGQPAAPAIANETLGINSDLAGACQKTFGPKAWHGNTISAVAAAMPTPESVKDTIDWTTYVDPSGNPYATPPGSPYGSWASYVQDGILAPLCAGSTPDPGPGRVGQQP